MNPTQRSTRQSIIVAFIIPLYITGNKYNTYLILSCVPLFLCKHVVWLENDMLKTGLFFFWLNHQAYYSIFVACHLLRQSLHYVQNDLTHKGVKFIVWRGIWKFAVLLRIHVFSINRCLTVIAKNKCSSKLEILEFSADVRATRWIS